MTLHFVPAIAGVILGSCWRRVGGFDYEKPILTYTLRNSTKTTDIAFSSNGRWFATWGTDTKVRLYLLGDEQPTLKFALRDATKGVFKVAFSFDNRYIASAGQDGQIRLYRFDGEHAPMYFCSLTDSLDPSLAIAFSRDNVWLAVGYASNYVRLYRLRGSQMPKLEHALRDWSVDDIPVEDPDTPGEIVPFARRLLVRRRREEDDDPSVSPVSVAPRKYRRRYDEDDVAVYRKGQRDSVVAPSRVPKAKPTRVRKKKSRDDFPEVSDEEPLGARVTKRTHKPMGDDFHYGELSDEEEEAPKPPKAAAVLPAAAALPAASAPPALPAQTAASLPADDGPCEDEGSDVIPELEEGATYDFKDAVGYIRDIAFSVDSAWLAAVGMDSKVRLWSIVAQGESVLKFTLTGAEGFLYAVSFSADQGWIAAGGQDGQVRLYSLNGDRQPVLRYTLEEAAGCIRSLTFSYDNQWLGTGDDDGNVRLYAMSENMDPILIYTLEESNTTIKSVAFSADAKWLGTGSVDHKVRIYMIPAAATYTGVLARDSVEIISLMSIIRFVFVSISLVLVVRCRLSCHDRARVEHPDIIPPYVTFDDG